MNGQELVWHKSSRSNGQANCVETASLPGGGRAVRDTKDRGTGPMLTFTKGEWDAFIAGVKDNEFD